MGFRINTNTAALTAHTSATMNNRNLDSSLAKLSSGLRINKAADDASGLAIADSLRSQASALGQAVSNGNDAIGLIQTADGALNEYSSILDTIKTKSVQAASDGQNTTSRLAIQKDINKLMEELNIIAKTTSFNGQKLLSGTFQNKEFQMGANANESVKVNIASAETSQIGQTSRATLNAGSDAGGTIQLTMKSALTGQSLTLKSVDIQYNNNTQNGMGALADEINKYSGDTGITAKAVVSSTGTTAVTAGTTGSDFAINGINIGAINVSANDNDGTLVNAINSKTTQTGVTASLSSDGKMTLTSDGRSIQVSGDVSVMGATAKEMTTVGHIELVQAGSAEFQIEGIGAGAVGAKIYMSGTTSMLKDSILAAGSIIQSASTLKAGTEVGGNVYTSTTKTMTLDTTLKAGSILSSSTILKAGTQMGGSVTISATGATQALTRDMLLTAGSTLAANTVLGAGTVVQQDFTDAASVEHKAGEVLTTTATIAAGGLTLSKDMVLKYDSVAANNSKIATASIVNVGSVLGGDFGVAASTTVTLAQDMLVKGGSTLGTATKIMAGSVLGGDIITSGSTTTYLTTTLKAGSSLASSSMLAQGSTVGGQIVILTNTALTEDMTIKAGSTLATGTRFKAGTILNQDMKLSTAIGTAASVDFKAGDVLTSDMYVGAAAANADRITLSADMVLLKGTGASLGQIGNASILMPNSENSGSVGLDNKEFTNLSNIDVTTLEGAMKAIDTVSAAITDLDKIRSDLGSAQNQITSTINNISVTQVNVKSAESNIRDVDFAAESANFSKYNILAQSGSYAMSQANSVQQNVLKLLQ